MVLPAGTTVPPLPYTVSLLLAVAGVWYRLSATGAELSERILLALSPWMVGGASLYVCYQIGIVPPVLSPLTTSPAVYLSTFVVAGLVWIAGIRIDRPAESLAVIGVLFSLVPIAGAVGYGFHRGTLNPTLPAFGLVASVVVAVLAWVAFDRLAPGATDVLHHAGLLAVFSHTLDGISTAIGIDVLGYGEQTPLSRAIMDLAGLLPTASVIGVGWLFVVVKLAVILVVVWFMADFVREEPGQGYFLLLVIVAVGLGPGTHNLLLYAVMGPAGF
ncbi:MAG: DUF63 family protein [Halodesulfurarchaeum sp.]